MHYLSVNLRTESAFLKDRFNLRWDCETGIVDNMLTVVEEYKRTWELLVSNTANSDIVSYSFSL